MQLLRGKDREADQAMTTEAHLLLWRYLRLLELRGVNFIRHASIGGLYVDFLNMEKGLVIEVAAERRRKTDKLEQERKDRWLAKQGFKVLRFTEEEIAGDMNMVLEMMWESFLDEAEVKPSLNEIAAKSNKARAEVKKASSLKTLQSYDNRDHIKEASVASISGRHKLS